MKRIAMAGFAHETNTFSPLPTRYEDFATRTGPFTGIVRWDEMKEMRGKRANDPSLGFLNAIDQLGGYEPVYILSTSTNPSSQVQLDAYNRITGIIVSEIEAAGPVDAVYLDLHGAMAYEGFHSGETELVRRIKARLGDIPVVTTFDLHGNIPQECFELTTAMVGCREYPHVDMYETGERAARLLHHHLQGRPMYKAFKRVPFIPVLSKTTTFTDPFKTIYASIAEVEKNTDVLCATIMEGFPPSDTAHTGPTIFAYALTQQAADEAVEYMYNAFLSHESEIVSSLPKPAECVKQAIELAAAADKPVIIAESLDNPGGGSSSDTVWVLEELVKQHVPETALGFIFDPESARKAHEAGEGAQVTLDLGGKIMPGHKPYHATFRVEKLYDGAMDGHGPLVAGLKMSLGKIAALKLDNIHIVVGSERVQAADSAPFRVLGIEPEKMEIVVLKSSHHFRADFEPICATILHVNEPAAMIENPADVDYKNLMEGIRLGGCGPEFHRKSQI